MNKINKQSSPDLLKKISDRTHVIGVVGLGYVGIPLMLAATHVGFKTVGFDIDKNRVDSLNNGISGIKHIPNEKIKKVVENNTFIATTEFETIANCDSILIAVPTPLTKYREPDLSYVVSTVQSISKYLRKGQLVVLESTTWPGTSEEVIKPILEKTGLKCGVDFFIAYSPEREDPGNADFETNTIPKIVGGDGPFALELATTLYSQFVKTVVPVSSAATAEAVKLTENIFRAVNIALVNELKVIFTEMNIDIWEVVDAAKTKPFGFMPFYPGPGLGGHCIPIDPFYLTWKAKEFDIATRFIELAGQINANMPQYVIAKLREYLDADFSKGLNGSNILLLGLAYKKNVDDMRESPSLTLLESLMSVGANVDYHDPYFPEIPKSREHLDLMGMRSIEISPEALEKYDAVLIATDHDNVDYRMIANHSRLVLDTRNACSRAGISGPNIYKA